MLSRLHVTENHGSERAKKPVFFSLVWALIHSTIGNFTLALITHSLMTHVSTVLYNVSTVCYCYTGTEYACISEPASSQHWWKKDITDSAKTGTVMNSETSMAIHVHCTCIYFNCLITQILQCNGVICAFGTYLFPQPIKKKAAVKIVVLTVVCCVWLAQLLSVVEKM